MKPEAGLPFTCSWFTAPERPCGEPATRFFLRTVWIDGHSRLVARCGSHMRVPSSWQEASLEEALLLEVHGS